MGYRVLPSFTEFFFFRRRIAGKKITGNKAPHLRDLAKWLLDNPMFDVDPKWSDLVKEKGNLPSDLQRRVTASSTSGGSGAGGGASPAALAAALGSTSLPAALAAAAAAAASASSGDPTSASKKRSASSVAAGGRSAAPATSSSSGAGRSSAPTSTAAAQAAAQAQLNFANSALGAFAGLNPQFLRYSFFSTLTEFSLTLLGFLWHYWVSLGLYSDSSLL